MRVHLLGGVAAGPVDVGQRDPDLGVQRVDRGDQTGRAGETLRAHGGSRGGPAVNSAVVQSLSRSSEYAARARRTLLASRLARLVPAAHAGGLDHGPCPAHVADLLGVESPHLGALVRDAVGDALGDEDPERLAHRGAGDAQRVGQGHLAQRRTGAQLAVEQRPPQLLGDPVDRRDLLLAERVSAANGVSGMTPIVRQFVCLRAPPCRTLGLSDNPTIVARRRT